jgi:outer membrane immunogenic protein
MKALSLAGGALLALFGSAAIAADLPIAPQPVPVYRPQTLFTGCYIGANVGTGWSWAGLTDTTGALGQGVGTVIGTHQTAGLIGGVQAGCDYQMGGVVFGVQGMFDGAGMTGNTIWQTNPNFSHNGKVPWFATLTGRVGFTIAPAAMIYGKAGVAWLKHDYSWNFFNAPIATASATPVGWTAGVGVEWIFAGNWSLFVEYDYIRVGERTVTFAFVAPPATTFPVSVEENINMITVGFNYRFGATPAPYIYR